MPIIETRQGDPALAASNLGGMRTVLMIDYFFPPMAGSAVQRTLGYVRHLAEYCWSPIVLTVRSGEHFAYDVSLLEGIPDAVTVERTGSIEPVRLVKRLLGMKSRKTDDRHRDAQSDGRPMWRGASWVRLVERQMLFPDRRIGWFPFAVARATALHRRHRIDVIYSTSTSVTSHLVAYALNRLHGIPWVADFQDPWVEDLAGPIYQRIGRRVERVILRNADRITFTTEPLRAVFQEHHPSIPMHKLVSIPMGFHPEAFEGIKPQRLAKFTITHFGALYADRSPRSFLEALAECTRQRPDVAQNLEVVFLGNFDAQMLGVTETLISRQNMTKIVRLAGIVPYRVGLQHLMSSDVLLLITAPGKSGQTLVPSKVYEYLAAAKPILALAPEGAVAQIVREANAGPVIDLNDVRGIAAAILTLYDRWREGRLAYPVSRDVTNRFTWRLLAGQLASILDDAIAARPSAGCPHR